MPEPGTLLSELLELRPVMEPKEKLFLLELTNEPKNSQK